MSFTAISPSIGYAEIKATNFSEFMVLLKFSQHILSALLDD
jgi:hypothetical protein